MKFVVPVMQDATLYTCDGQVALGHGDIPDESTLLPCVHGYGMRIDEKVFDTREELEDWLASKE